MRDQITQYLATRNKVSFPELVEMIPESLGERMLFSDNESLILWEGMSELFVEAIESLLADGVIVLQPISLIEFQQINAFGRYRSLDYPVAKRIQNYTKPHWIPALVCRGDMPARRR